MSTHASPQFVVEKGVPYTPQRTPLSAEIWAAMEACDVGDSFIIDMTNKRRGTVGVLISRHAMRMNRRYSSKTQDGVMRVWRVK